MAEFGPTALLDGYRMAAEDLRRIVLAQLEASWAGLAGDYSDQAMAAWAADTLALAEGAQAEVGALTAAYLAEIETALERAAAPVALDVIDLTSTEALRGVAGTDVWARPAVTVWTELAHGAALSLAADRGLARARSIAETNLALAHTHTAAEATRRSKVTTGYTRVPRGGRSCALCLLASTQRYHRGNLMPIHPGCHCAVNPIVDGAPAARVIDPDRLEGVHRAIEAATGSRDLSGKAYADYVVVHDHGEIGPVLSVRGQHFTGPGDI